MHRRTKCVLPLVGLVLWAGALAVFAQEPAPEAGATAPEPDEYSEFEAIPPPNVKLGSDVLADVPEKPVAETQHSAEEGKKTGEARPDAFMTQLNRELDARRGAGPEAAGQALEGAPADRTSYNILKAFGWLLVVVAMILLVYYFLQRRSSGGKLLTGSRLGAVLGRLYLNPRVCLHFVRTGGKVLVIGQSQSALSLIADFDEAEFAAAREESRAGGEDGAGKTAPEGGREFFSELRANLAEINRETGGEMQEANSPVDEDDIAALRGDIHRLREYLRDSTRESEP
ncbi:MAG TPA: flagellar biosynthetic protein FliO [Candidatus Hydrogenedentes bacterium]|nr:flagellar biosynthetic protein FliO [Candidatus Hydrogenedentota bacterium]HQM48681.1 flagellar biosynthetic protein FliO [Candidatus Hydrogenedentota bacterium]